MYELVPITSVPNVRNVVGTRCVYKIKADGVYKGRLVVLGWSQVPGIDCGGTLTPVCRLSMNVTRDREEGTTTINQKEYTEEILQRYGTRGCNPAYTP